MSDKDKDSPIERALKRAKKDLTSVDKNAIPEEAKKLINDEESNVLEGAKNLSFLLSTLTEPIASFRHNLKDQGVSEELADLLTLQVANRLWETMMKTGFKKAEDGS